MLEMFFWHQSMQKFLTTYFLQMTCNFFLTFPEKYGNFINHLLTEQKVRLLPNALSILL